MTPFETKTDLLPHQRDAVAKLLPSRVGGLFMDMGTGKSRTAIEFAHVRASKIDRIIWCCPVTLRDTVEYEIRKHTDSADIYVFDDHTTTKTVDRNARWVVVGIESLSASKRVVFALNTIVTDATMVVVDESTYIKGHNAMRTQRITHIAERARYRMILTGTPLTQGVVDLYAQMYFLSPKILGYRSWYSFARNHLEYSDKFPGMIVRTHNIGYIAARLQPYVYQVRKDECLTLPEKLYETRRVRMTPEQREAYDLAKEEIFLSLEMDDFDSITIFRLFTALQSIVCGFWNRLLTPAHLLRCRDVVKKIEHLEFPERRTAALVSTVAEMPENEKIVIWGKFRYSLRRISAALAAEYGPDSVTEYHGDMPNNARGASIDKFRSTARFLVATQSSGGHGLTLTEASHMIFFANGFKYSERLQAEDRIHRIGQTQRCTYIDIVTSDSIDERINEAIAKKANVLQEFRNRVDAIKRHGIKGKMREMVKNL